MVSHESGLLAENTMLQTRDEPIGVLENLCINATHAVDDLMPRSLVIGTHSVKPDVGEGLLPHYIYSDAKRDLVYGTPHDVLAALQNLTHKHYSHYTLIVSGFEAHHFYGRDLQNYIDILRILCHGVVLFGDYTLSRHASHELVAYTRSKAEKIQQQLHGGYQPWFQQHAVFTPHSFMANVHSTEWKSVRGIQFKHCKIGVTASPSLSENEMDSIIHESVTL